MTLLNRKPNAMDWEILSYVFSIIWKFYTKNGVTLYACFKNGK
jgi:hypothetical protein